MSNNGSSENSQSTTNQPGTQIKCIIKITQPDGNVIQVESSSTGIIPELEKIDLTSRKGLMDFISLTDKGIIAIRNDAAKKAVEAYAQAALKKTNPQQANDK